LNPVKLDNSKDRRLTNRKNTKHGKAAQKNERGGVYTDGERKRNTNRGWGVESRLRGKTSSSNNNQGREGVEEGANVRAEKACKKARLKKKPWKTSSPKREVMRVSKIESADQKSQQEKKGGGKSSTEKGKCRRELL